VGGRGLESLLVAQTKLGERDRRVGEQSIFAFCLAKLLERRFLLMITKFSKIVQFS
jgi:hypothetical protein